MPKIRERGISRKHLVFLDMQQPLGSTNLVCSWRLGMGSPQHTNSQGPLRISLVNTCWSLQHMKSALIGLGGP